MFLIFENYIIQDDPHTFAIIQLGLRLLLVVLKDVGSPPPPHPPSLIPYSYSVKIHLSSIFKMENYSLSDYLIQGWFGLVQDN